MIFVRTFLVTLLISILLLGVSFAEKIRVTVVVKGGNLILTVPVDFSLPTVTLGGSAEFSTESMQLYTVEDARGTGGGWNLDFKISRFESGSGCNRVTLPRDSFYMRLLQNDIQYIWGQGINIGRGPRSLHTTDYNVTEGTEKFITAERDYGMGKYTANINHKLLVPAESYAGTYTATLTVTLNATP